MRVGVQFRRTHDLLVLMALQPASVRLRLEGLDLQQLQQSAVDARYPADLPDVSHEEAGAAVGLAEQIISAIQSDIEVAE